MEVVLWLEKHVRIVGSSLSSPQIMEESVLDVDIKCLCRLMKVRAEKGKNVHTLVMTATPIPRTLSLILYGDLDVSIIDELPPGRKEVKTYAVGEGMIARINKFIENKIKEGRQIYIVCPFFLQLQKYFSQPVSIDYFSDVSLGNFYILAKYTMHGTSAKKYSSRPSTPRNAWFLPVVKCCPCNL